MCKKIFLNACAIVLACILLVGCNNHAQGKELYEIWCGNCLFTEMNEEEKVIHWELLKIYTKQTIAVDENTDLEKLCKNNIKIVNAYLRSIGEPEIVMPD